MWTYVWTMNVLISIGIRFAMNADTQISSWWLVLWLRGSCIVSLTICNACLLFLLQFSFNFHYEFPYFTITVQRSVRTPLSLGEDMVFPEGSVWWLNITTVSCHFENSQGHHGHFTVQSSLRLWDHGVLSVLITHYRILDIVRSSAEVKRSRVPCMAPSSLTERPPGVGLCSSTRHVEIGRMSGEMYIVAMLRQN